MKLATLMMVAGANAIDNALPALDGCQEYSDRTTHEL